MPRTWIALIALALLLLPGCAPATAAASASPSAVPPTAIPTAVPPTLTSQPPTLTPTGTLTLTPSTVPSATVTLTTTPTPDTRLAPEQWQEWPVLPVLSARARALYQAGLQQGNNPRAFSKIGDCQNINSHFLAAFDDPQLYKLGGKFENLLPAIQQFSGMFKRESAAVRNGFNVAAVLSPIQADPAVCKSGETPVTCELRLNRPAFVLISMETWWAKKPAQEYEKYMRQILDLVIAAKSVPILATKADNLEGDSSINATLARLAYEYDIPLWNFWKAVQPLPGGGLTDDGFHLSHDSQRPDDPLFYQRLSEPKAWDYGWTVRNVTALQALDAVWRQAARP
jgi:hypothetical protein